MAKHFKVLSVKNHVWNVMNNVNNVVLLKCTCCEKQRIGVAEQREKTRYYDGTKVTYNELTFWYHGYDINYAEQLFNKLVQKRSENDDEKDTTSNNVNKRNNNDNKTLVINNVKISIRGERR